MFKMLHLDQLCIKQLLKVSKWFYFFIYLCQKIEISKKKFKKLIRRPSPFIWQSRVGHWEKGGSVHVLWTFYFYLFSVLLGLYFMEQVAAQAISAGKMLF